MVFPEAAARGLLLVGPSHGGPAEILEQGALGFVADAFSPEALADVYARVVALTDSEADALRDAADRSCRQRFSELRLRRRWCLHTGSTDEHRTLVSKCRHGWTLASPQQAHQIHERRPVQECNSS